MTDLNLRRLDDVSTIQSGSGFPTKFQGLKFEKYPFYKVSDMNLVGNEVVMDASNNSISEDVRLELRAKLFPNGTIIFPKVGGAILTNKKRLISKPSCVDNNVMGLIPVTSLMDSRYLYYYMLNLELYEISNKANPPSITQTTVKGLMISTPPLEEQKQIVVKLDQCFEAIDKAKVNAAKNLENAKELFQSKLNEIFSQKGEGWVEKKLGDVCEKTINIKWANFPDDEFEYIDLSAVSRTSLKITGTTTVNASNAPSRAKKIIQTNDIIFATTRPTLKRVAIVLSELNDQICSTGYTVLRGVKGVINHKLIYYFLQTDIFMDRMESIQRGTSYPAVTDKDVKNSVISLPVSTIQQQDVTNKLDALRKQTQSLESKYQQELNSLEELKKSILQKAFEGEL
jgi:type I restriction enzyme S subunit